jgi:uncharacterized cupredoxin-like copper-binding protein
MRKRYQVGRAVATIACIILCGAGSPALAATALRIVATDQGFQAPRTVAAGLRHLVFENHGKEVHEAMLVKLPPGMGADDFVAQVKAGILFPKGALDYSGPGLTSPGESTELWLRADPGEYVLICWNHPRSSVQSLTVREAGEADEVPPKEDVVLQLRDFRFEIRGRLKKGAQVIRVETPGPSMHEADLFRLHDGRTAADVQRWYKADLAGPAPADALGGVLDSNDIKRVVWLKKTFSPGRYVFHCAMPMSLDAKSGDNSPTHADAGMVATFEIGE